jgi:hypothetical protein
MRRQLGRFGFEQTALSSPPRPAPLRLIHANPRLGSLLDLPDGLTS